NAGSPELPGLEPAAPVDYPAFLGRERRGVVEDVQPESDWSAHPPQQLWRQPIGLGYSAFAVNGSRAVTQEQRGDKELIVCYALATGRALWAHTNLVRFSENMGGDGPRATPTLAGGRVYAPGATGILDCLELSDGRLIWSRDILKENHTSNLPFGKASSPSSLVLTLPMASANGRTVVTVAASFCGWAICCSCKRSRARSCWWRRTPLSSARLPGWER